MKNSKSRKYIAYVYIQWKPLNRASVYRAKRLFEQFWLKKNDPIFFLLYKIFAY